MLQTCARDSSADSLNICYRNNPSLTDILKIKNKPKYIDTYTLCVINLYS
jgi:hypothetical protein